MNRSATPTPHSSGLSVTETHRSLRSDMVVQSPTASRCHLVVMGLAIFMTMLPVTMLVPVLRELIAQRFDATPFWTHTFMSINMLGAVVAAPFGGAMADRLGRRKPILVAALLLDAGLLAAMIVMPTLPSMLFARFFEGAAHVLALSMLMAMASDWANPVRRGRTMGVIGSALIFGTACGAPLGGRIGQHAPLMVFYIGSGVALIAAVLAIVMLRDAPRRVQPARVREALQLAVSHRELFVPYAFAFIDRFCVGVIVSSFTLFLAEYHSMTPSERGGHLAIFLFPFAILCYPAGRLADRYGRVGLMCTGSIGFGVVFASYGFLPAGVLPLAMLASGVLSAMMFSPNLAMCSDLAPSDKQATAYAGFNVAGSLGFLMGPLVGGAVCGFVTSWSDAATAYRAAFVIAGATEVLCALIALPWLLSLRRRSLTQ